MNINRFKWLFWIGFFLILALPLLNLPPWFSPPDWGKTIIFRIILSVLIFIFFWQILSQEAYSTFSKIVKNVGRNLAFLLLISLFFIFLLNTIFSLDRNFSLWGSPYRSGGFLNFAFYIIFAILAFFILSREDWQKIWDFAILIGILVSLIAVFQWQGLLKEILITFELRPPSTIGGPIFLAIYLLLLSFLNLSFGLREKRLPKKFFYFLSLFLFIFVAIFITQTRAAFLGIFFGFFYFIFFFPLRRRKISLTLKLTAFISLFLGFLGFLYLNTQALPQFIQENKILSPLLQRFTLEAIFSDSRISAWKVSFKALKERPILGYGPENFSIGFDKFYDPALPGIEKAPDFPSSWWDRAHNFIFDIGVTAGIPALIIYLLLFAVLFWQLQKLKTSEKNAEKDKKEVISHGLQATFVAYLVANFFSFDTFSSYIILFLLVGYSLHLISDANLQRESESTNKKIPGSDLWRLQKYRGIIIFLFFIGLIWFIWVFNLKPLQVNKEINLADSLAEKGDYQSAFLRIEKILPAKTFLDDYLRLKYIDLIRAYSEKKPKEIFPLAEKAVSLLRENVKIRPTYTRSWILLGSYLNILLEKKELSQEEFEKLKKEANLAFEKAYQLSPKRQEVYTDWVKTDILTAEYQKAKEKSQKCIDLNPKLPECWWYLGIANIFSGKIEEAKENIAQAKDLGYPINSEFSLLQLTKAYAQIKDCQELIPIYQKLIEIKPGVAQYHASLATCYKEIDEIKKAREEALKVLELMPETKAEVEEFLKGLY